MRVPAELLLTSSPEGEFAPGSELIPAVEQDDKGKGFPPCLHVAILNFCAPSGFCESSGVL